MKLKYPIEKWKWFGVPGHLCVSSRCRFHLQTKVGPYKISTVGAYYQNAGDEIMTEVGRGRDYETYVFKGMNSYSEIDSSGLSLREDAKGDPYKADALAEKMHMKMCLKYAKGSS